MIFQIKVSRRLTQIELADYRRESLHYSAKICGKCIFPFATPREPVLPMSSASSFLPQGKAHCSESNENPGSWDVNSDR